MIVDVVWLVFVSPAILRLLQWSYGAPKISVLHDNVSGENFETRQVALDEDEWKADTSARRDIHMAAISFLFEAAAEFCVGLSRTGTQMIVCESRFNISRSRELTTIHLAVSLIGGMSAAGSALRSAAVASVPPLQSGRLIPHLIVSLTHLHGR